MKSIFQLYRATREMVDFGVLGEEVDTSDGSH